MNWFVNAIVAAVTSFVATNIDDIVIVMLFFSQLNSQFRRQHVVVGQYLGFSLLVAASLPGFFGGLVIPQEWIGLLGLVPIGIGISQWREQAREKHEPETMAVHVVAAAGDAKSELPFVSSLTKLVSPQIYQVAAVTLANGGDNIGIYVPLFAHVSLAELGVIVSTFFVLVGVWCYVAYQLTLHPMIASVLTRYGQIIVPFVLIGLGIFILVDSETYRLLPRIDVKR